MFFQHKNRALCNGIFLSGMSVIMPLQLAYADGEGKWTSEVGLESTFFTEQSDTSNTRSNYSTLMKTEYFKDWNDGADSFTFSPRARLDEHDPERNTFDI